MCDLTFQTSYLLSRKGAGVAGHTTTVFDIKIHAMVLELKLNGGLKERRWDRKYYIWTFSVTNKADMLCKGMNIHVFFSF